MSYTTIIGYISSIVTTIYVMIGLSAQIIKNYRTKKAADLSFIMVITLVGTFICWTIYGYLKSDFFLLIPNGLGFIFEAIILTQLIIYAKPRSSL